MRAIAAVMLVLVLLGGSVSAGAQSTGSASSQDPGSSNRDAIAVIIGNQRYANGIPEVRYAANDAAARRRKTPQEFRARGCPCCAKSAFWAGKV